MVKRWHGDAKYHRPVKSSTVYKECREALGNDCDGVHIIAPEFSNCAINAVDKALEKYGVTVILNID
jgi:hypothetical protein